MLTPQLPTGRRQGRGRRLPDVAVPDRRPAPSAADVLLVARPVAMKTLYLLRHAEAESGGPEINDFDRQLTTGGLVAAESAGRHLAGLTPPPSVVVASAAARARRTAELAQAMAGLGSPVQYDNGLYLATAAACVEVLRRVGQADAVLLVGHNPGLEELAGSLVQRQIVLPTAGLLTIELPVGDWAELELGARGRLVSLWASGV